MEPSNRIVLLLDDSELILRMLTRLLKRRFDAVLTATNTGQAAALLRNNKVTTLVCDHGISCPSGGELIAHWRKRYPSIEKTVVLTGADVESIEIPPEVDTLLSKTSKVSEIITEIGMPGKKKLFR
ncbi:MAG: response regulator [Deltaproteobacteria bacterium]|nr:response regulator [Deltaproteobacteria bacterium]